MYEVDFRPMESHLNERNAYLLVGFICLLSGLQLNLMDIDAAQYAAISKEMFFNKSFLEVYCRGLDYLDKPPMLFWTSVLSFKIFGIHEWSYRLPSILASMLGLYSLYKYSNLYYPKPISIYSVLIFASSQAFFLMNHDVRTDTMLTGFILFSLWQLSTYFKNQNFISLIQGTIGISLAMMTKGPIGPIAPMLIVGLNLIYSNQLKRLFHYHLILAFILLVLLLLPMSYGLYIQFDLHPEKEAYGLKGPSGLRFYYWIQSFGRITHESNWDNNPEPFFLVHSFIWSFLPWSILFFAALFKIFKKIIFRGFKSYLPEIGTIGGFIILFCMMSFSSYQLPHYTFFLHPLAAIILSHFFYHLNDHPKIIKTISILQYLQYVIIGSLLFYLNGWAFPESPFLFNSIVIAILIYQYDLHFCGAQKTKSNIIWNGFLMMCVCNFILNIQIYPSLFEYQANEKIAEFMNKKHAEFPLHVYQTDYWYSCDFKLKSDIQKENNLDSLIKFGEKNKLFIMTNESGLPVLNKNLKIKDVYSFKNFPVSNLTLDFINPYKRYQTISYLYLVETK